MSEDGPVREPAAMLADELRAVIEALSVREVPEDALARAGELARALRAELVGAPQPRWYDADPETRERGRTARLAYLHHSPVRGTRNPLAPPLETEIVTDADGARRIEGRALLGRAYEGPPHGVHGGWVAALFDEVLGATQGLTGEPGMTALLTVKYRKVTPIEQELRFRGWIERAGGRRIVARATCSAGNLVTAEAEGLFLRVDFDALEAEMRMRRSRD